LTAGPGIRFTNDGIPNHEQFNQQAHCLRRSYPFSVLRIFPLVLRSCAQAFGMSALVAVQQGDGPCLADVVEFCAGLSVPEACFAEDGAVSLIREADLPMLHNGAEPPLYWVQASLRGLAGQRFLQVGDVIFHPQYPRRALVFDMTYARFIACAPLITCRIHDPATLLPVFLAWYLGTDRVRAALYDTIRANACIALPPPAYGALALPPASMAVQQEIAQTWHEERQREQSTLALFRRMRENMDAVLLGWLDMGSGVVPMGA
jgi:hypothetical protein